MRGRGHGDDGHGDDRHLSPSVLTVLAALSAFAPLAMDMYLPGLPALSRDLSTSTSLAQLTLTACMLGLAVGQVFAGPVSDARGRRAPVLVGILVFTAASVMCALSPNITSLLVFRLLQGVAGAAGIVIARAIVRDLHDGAAAARIYALLMAVMVSVPIAAPLIGGQLMRVAGWRGVFYTLAGIGVVMLAVVWRVLPETLPRAARHPGGVRPALHSLGRLLRDRIFAVQAAVLGLSFASMVAYIAGSPFVLQDVHGVSPQVFSVLFAMNVVGIGAASLTSRRLVGRTGPLPLLRAGVIQCSTGSVVVLVSTVTGAGLVPLLVGLFLTVSATGLVAPNITALALESHAAHAGSASGLLGLIQFSCGAAVAPLVGLAGAHDALPMAVVIACCACGALIAFLVMGRLAVPVRVIAAEAHRA